MNAADSPRGAPPLLALVLALAALACGGTALLSRSTDLPARLEHRLAAAQGGGSAETAAWLRSGVLDRGLAVVAVGLALGAVAAWRRPRRPAAAFTDHPDRVMLAATLALVAVNFRSTLAGGFFRYDDFELLAVARDGDFWASLWQIHGDHFLPLTRVLFKLGYEAFGVNPLPWNAGLLLLLAGVVLAGDRLLATEGVGLGGRLAFAVLVTAWSPIAEIMTGYYILGTYLLIALVGLLVAWALRLPPAPGRVWPLPAVAAGVAVAPLVDVSGFYVAGLALVALAANLARAPQPAAAWRHAGGGVAVVLAALALPLAAAWYAYHVVHPGTFLGMAGAAPRGGLRLLADLAYLLDAGVLLTFAVPFVYARLPAGLLFPLLVVAAGAGGLVLVRGFRAADRAGRITLLAWLAGAGGIGLMVALGRHEPGTIIVRWAAKHVAPVYLWTALVLVLAASHWRRRLADRGRAWFDEGAAAALAVFLLAQSAFGWLGMAVAFPPFGYAAEIRDAGRRREAMATLRDELGSRLGALGPGATVLPVDGRVLAARWPSLFRYDLSHYAAFLEPAGPRLRWVRNAAMSEWRAPSVATVPDLRAAVSPAFLAALERDPVLQGYYLAPLELETRVIKVAAGANPAGALVAVPAGGTAEVPVEPADGAFLLLLQVERVDAAPDTPVQLDVAFRRGTAGTDWRGPVRLPDGAAHVVDLRQAPAFALGEHVRDVRLIVAQPGTYRFRLARLLP